MKHTPIRCFEGKAQPGDPFWQFVAKGDDDTELQFYGVISEYSWLNDEISPRKFREELERVGQGKPITLRIDSPGGDPIAASAISAIISSYPGKVTAQIDGQASSAAVLVALAASRIRVMDTAYMMVHDPAVSVFMAALDIETLSHLHTSLQSIKAGMVAAYAARTGLSEKQLNQMLTDETWMSAQEAVDFGFADEIVKGGQKRSAKKFENVLRNFEHVPPALLNMAEEPEEASEGDEPPVAEPIEPDEAGQAVPGGTEDGPAEDPLAAPKLALQYKRVVSKQGVTMYMRELIQKRSTLVAEADTLVKQADGEGRDFTAEERARFVAILGEGETPGEIGALDAQIEQIEGERERLRAAAEKKFSDRQTNKPEPSAPGNTMKRGEFVALSPADQAAFVRNGGKITD